MQCRCCSCSSWTWWSGSSSGSAGASRALWQGEVTRAAAPVARIERVEPVPVEVMDHVTHRVRVCESDLSDPRRRHPLRRQQDDLRSPPAHDRAAAPADHRKQPVALLVTDLPQLHPAAILPPVREQVGNTTSTTAQRTLQRNRQTLPVSPLAWGGGGRPPGPPPPPLPWPPMACRSPCSRRPTR
jgi:hypothetical protein